MPLAMPPSLICSKDLGLRAVFQAHSGCNMKLTFHASLKWGDLSPIAY